MGGYGVLCVFKVCSGHSNSSDQDLSVFRESYGCRGSYRL